MAAKRPSAKSNRATAPSDKRLDNLTPFKKGQSGNPTGQPRGWAEFKAWARENSEEAGKTLIANLHDKDGHVRNKAAQTIWNYAWGLPKAVVELGSDESKPLRMEVTSEPPSPAFLADVLRILEVAGVSNPAPQDEQVLAALADGAPDSLPKP